MSPAQGTGAGAPEAQEYAGELGGFVLARGTVDRVGIRRGDTDWLAAAWADPGTRVLVLDNDRALVRFGDKEAELILVPPAEAPEGLRVLLGVDDADVAYFGVMGPPGCLDPLEALAAPDSAPVEAAPAEAEPVEAEPAEVVPPEAAPPEAAPPEAAPPEAAPAEAGPQRQRPRGAPRRRPRRQRPRRRPPWKRRPRRPPGPRPRRRTARRPPRPRSSRR